MGNEEINSTLKIIIIGGEDKLLEQIFPVSIKNDKFKEISEKLEVPYKYRKFIKKFDKINILWEAFILQDYTDDNFDKSLNLIYTMLDLPNDEGEEEEEEEKKIIQNENIENNSEFDRKFIVIKFGSNNIEYLINMLNVQSRVFLPQLAVVTDKNLNEDEKLYDNRFLTVIHEDKLDQTNTIKNIFSYLWDRENYYNQRGNELNQYLPSNILKINKQVKPHINILITGLSRAGKSTIINLLSRKLVSLECSEGKSVTKNINEYEIERNINGNEEKIGIKLIDTPGLKKYKDKNGKIIDTTKLVEELIEKKLKECQDSKDDIHLIYFMFGKNANLEDQIDFFKFLQNINKERTENKQKKIPIIFIGNLNVGKDGIDALKKILKENNLMDLYEKIDKTNKKIDFKNFAQKNKNEKKISLKENIIEVNLIRNVNDNNTKVYGIDIILKATLHFLQKNNPFNNFIILEETYKKIQIYLNKINKGEKLNKDENSNFLCFKEKIKNIIIEISDENTLLNQIKNPDNILERANYEAKKVIYFSLFGGFITGLIPIPLLDIPFLLPLYSIMIIKIGNCYSISFSEIDNMSIINLIIGLDVKITKSSKFQDDNMISKVQGAQKVLVNSATYYYGENLGKDLAKNLGESKLKDWAKRQLRFVKSKGNVNFVKEIEEIGMTKSSKFHELIENLIQFFPMMKKGVENGVKNNANQLGEKVKDIYLKNTVEFTKKEINELSKKSCSKYVTKITNEANKYISSFSKFIPILGSVINGIMDAYNVNVIGNNAIKYFEEYVNKTIGCDYLIRQKNQYLKIFENINNIANEDFINFIPNYIY